MLPGISKHWRKTLVDVLLISLLSLVILLAGLLILLVWFLTKVQSETQMRSQLFLSQMAALHQKGLLEHTRALKTVSRESTRSLALVSMEHQKIMKDQATLLDKALALVATSDPVSFQQVQVMGTPTSSEDTEVYDPSEEGEIARIALRNQRLSEQGDDVSDFEYNLVGDLDFDPADYYPVAD